MVVCFCHYEEKKRSVDEGVLLAIVRRGWSPQRLCSGGRKGVKKAT